MPHNSLEAHYLSSSKATGEKNNNKNQRKRID